MKPDLEEALRQVIRAVEFQSTDRFTFAERSSTEWAGNGMPSFHPNSRFTPAMSPVVATLQNVLYGNCYVKPFDGSISDVVLDMTSGAADEWVDSLSAANSSKERWEEGWRVQSFLPTGQIYAERPGANRAFWPGEFLTRGSPGMAPQPGTPIAVLLPREARHLQPGFYFVFGETVGEQHDEFANVRYYWNLQQEGAAELVRLLTAVLNKYQVPFKLKVVNHPRLLGRSDASVLYVGRRYYRIAAEIAFEVHEAVGQSLNDAVPLFTQRLRRGLAFAEDPGPQESFGMARCRLLAEGLSMAFQEGISGVDDRLERINRHFAQSGITLEHPHLNTATADPYEFPA